MPASAFEVFIVVMRIGEATNLIKTCAEKMNARYAKVVFDEWAIVSMIGRKGRLLAYQGPRKQAFQRDFLKDAGCLRTPLLTAEHDPGDFEFAPDGVGTGFEAFTALGSGVYLIWNNTALSMDGIAREPRWLAAQVPFVDLTEEFRADPLSLAV
jgi:hypothetical protein